MKHKIITATVLSLLIACGQGKTDDKKAQLDKLRKDRDALNEQIAKLETELDATDSTALLRIKKVEITPVVLTTFRDYIDIQGRIDADENVSLSPEMGGMVTRINVKPGDEVSKGQVLAETDNKVIVQGIAELQNGLDLATTMYNKQKNLWDQKIGTELQYLQAKNQKESLEKKMATLQQQLEMTKLKSPINGTVDAVDIKVGQMSAPGFQAIRVVNFENLKVKGEVSEGFAGRVKKGDVVEIYFPDMSDSLTAKVDFAAKVISPLTRTFTVQVNLDNKKDYHPNMVAVMKIVDYQKDKSIVVPVGTIQHAEEGDYVFIEKDGKATKVKVKVGHIYNGWAEILEGLNEGDHLITKGYQELNEGEKIKV
ncbi:MAG TPA: efflux RND transporter periplasmic adaptor subunit [Bacteroidia bacterium]